MSVSDIIYLRELKVEVCIGVYAWEQQIKQPVTFDLELNFDTSKAAHSGLVTDSIDYTEVVKIINGFVADKKFVLLETLTENIASLLLLKYQIAKVRVRANKLAAVPGVKEVGVIIERVRENANR